jgi:hypothetical protein
MISFSDTSLKVESTRQTNYKEQLLYFIGTILRTNKKMAFLVYRLLVS